MDITKHQRKSSFRTRFPLLILAMHALEGQQAEVRPTCRETYIGDMF